MVNGEWLKRKRTDGEAQRKKKSAHLELAKKKEAAAKIISIMCQRKERKNEIFFRCSALKLSKREAIEKSNK